MFGLALFASGCDHKVEQPTLEPLTEQKIADARNAAESIIGASGRTLFICGQADGLGVFSLDWKSGFQSDGIKNGRLIFLIRDDGRADVFFRDSLGKYLSTLDDGGAVQRISLPSKQVESWIISYPSNGIVETHNITTIPEVGLVNLWTSNKPTSLIGASAKLFRSSCVRA